MTPPDSLKDTLAENWEENRPVLEAMLAAAREGLARADWKIGDPADKMLWPIVGALTVHLGRELRVDQMPPSEVMVREQVARDLRAVAARHPEGSVRHAAYMDAAELAEQGNR
ncbi:hypothetical protein ACFWV1_26020 [Streptomyces sp. NPDC058700]|uniref:hypothetical protein n=1 Tax=Streptomyces sp. NPDC058700 TaxID=3346607 RepID=UPI003649F511